MSVKCRFFLKNTYGIMVLWIDTRSPFPLLEAGFFVGISRHRNRVCSPIRGEPSPLFLYVHLLRGSPEGVLVMSKRYQWLKMDQGFFQSKHIKKLRQLGVEHVLVYTKLMLLSIKHDGKVFHSGIEDTLSEELALDIDEDAAVVEEVLHFMARYNLIKELPDSTYEIVEAVECLGKVDLSTPRVEKSRAKKKSALETLHETNETLHETDETNCNVSSLLHETDETNCNGPRVEKSRVEVEEEVEVEKSREEKTTTPDSDPIDRLTAIYVSVYENRWQSTYRKIKKPVNWPEFVYEMAEDEFEKIAVKHVLGHIGDPDKSTVEYFATAVNRYRQV